MTPQKAILELHCLCKGISNLDTLEAITQGINALEKQIPKKPFKEVIAKKNTRMVCPACFVNLHYLVEQQNYCPDCGQALDWGGL